MMNYSDASNLIFTKYDGTVDMRIPELWADRQVMSAVVNMAGAIFCDSTAVTDGRWYSQAF